MADLIPITLTPQGIREAFVAQLILCNIAGGNIVTARSRPTRDSDAPIVNVFSPGSSGDGKGHLPRFDTSFKIICAATVVLPIDGTEFEDKDAAIGTAIDVIELAIKTAILGDDIFAASFRQFPAIRVQKGTTTEGKAIRGTVNIEFTMLIDEQYELTNKAKPYGDLEQIDILTALDGFVRLVTHDGDRIVTHDGDRINLGGAPILLLRPIFRVRLVTHDGDDLVTHDGNNLVTHESTGFEA